MEATTVLINGDIITMKDGLNAEAVAIEKDRIIAVGTSKEILEMANGLTSVIDLKGKTVLPGFIDTHIHIVGYGFSFEAIDLLGIPSVKKMIEDCRDHIEEHDIPEGTWILGRGFDQNKFEDSAGFPTSKDLNKISDKHPILLLRTCGHIGIANDKALETAGVEDRTFIRGGSFDRYEDGKLNGVIKEASLEWFKKQMSQARTIEDLKRAIRTSCADLARFGITSVHTEDSYDLGYGGDLTNLYESYRQLLLEGNLDQRVYQKISLPRIDDSREFLKRSLKTREGNDFFRIGPVKLWADGTLGGRTAWLLEDYSDGEPGQKGISVYDDDEMEEIIRLCHDKGMQMCIHSIGDAALEQILNAYEKVVGDSKLDHRHRLVHCQIGNYSQYERIGKLGLNVNIQPLHTRTDYPLIENRLGKKRASQCHAWKTLLENKVVVTASSDVPCTNCTDAANVFNGIDSIVNRGKWLENEEVTVYQALKMYTVDAAYSAFEEDVKGSISTGKLADLVVVSDNPLSVDKDRIKDIEVEMTILGGKLTYSR